MNSRCSVVRTLSGAGFSLASAPGPLFILCFERAWSVKMRHLTSLSTSVGVSMETLSFHHDIVPEYLWPSSSLVRVLE